MEKTTYQIYPLYLGEVSIQEKSCFTYMVDPGVKTTCPFIAFLLIGSDGKHILVDTGGSDEEYGAKYHSKVTVPPDCDILTVLKKSFDLTPSDIDFIINTHLHWDHSRGNHLFPGKKIYVQKKELQYALNPLPIHYQTYESPQLGITSNWLRAKGQFEVIDGDMELTPGIRVVLLPGHSEGLQGVLVDTCDGTYLLASDCINLYENWNGNGKLKHIVGGIHTDLKQYYATYDKIEALERDEHIKIIPGHDTEVLKHSVFPDKK